MNGLNVILELCNSLVDLPVSQFKTDNNYVPTYAISEGAVTLTDRCVGELTKNTSHKFINLLKIYALFRAIPHDRKSQSSTE